MIPLRSAPSARFARVAHSLTAPIARPPAHHRDDEQLAHPAAWTSGKHNRGRRDDSEHERTRAPQNQRWRRRVCGRIAPPAPEIEGPVREEHVVTRDQPAPTESEHLARTFL